MKTVEIGSRWPYAEVGFPNPNPELGVPNCDFKRLAGSRFALRFTKALPVPKASNIWSTLYRNYAHGRGTEARQALHLLSGSARRFPQAISMTLFRLAFWQAVSCLRKTATYPIGAYLGHLAAALQQRECTCNLCLAQMEYSCGQYNCENESPSRNTCREGIIPATSATTLWHRDLIGNTIGNRPATCYCFSKATGRLQTKFDSSTKFA